MENAELDASAIAATGLDKVDHGGSHLQQQQQLMSMEELPPASLVSQDYLNWEAPVQSQHQHHHHQQHPTAVYTLPESLAGENGWFNHYATETGIGVISSDYSPYAVNAATQVFSYDPIASYEPLMYHSQTDVAVTTVENGLQQYTVQELVDGCNTGGADVVSSVQCYNGNSNGDYTYQSVVSSSEYGIQHHQHYQQQTFEHSFSYNQHHQHVPVASSLDTYILPGDPYGYHPVAGDPIGAPVVFVDPAVDMNGTASMLLASDASLGPSSQVGQAESSSNSSSEEDGTLSDMTTSLASIVKETMVSV